MPEPATTPIIDLALAPLARYLCAADVIEILSQRPGELWIERAGAGALERILEPSLTAPRLHRLARLVAGASAQEIGPQRPLLAATLPPHAAGGGERIQIVLPPAAPEGVAFAIRKQVVIKRGLGAYGHADGFDAAVLSAPCVAAVNADLAALAQAGDPARFLAAAIAARETILISGGTSSGKTTLLNALLAEIDPGDRVITIEDAPELDPPQACRLRLVASRGAQNEARLGVGDLLEAALRMRPDRLLLGELRGAEAAIFLRAINTGHQGSLTTIHADSPQAAFEQLALMVLQAGWSLTRADVLAYLRAIIRVVVQTARVGAQRRIVAVRYMPASP